MKHYKCPGCARERDTEDNVIMAICGSCQIEMKEFPNGFKREVEIYGE